MKLALLPALSLLSLSTVFAAAPEPPKAAPAEPAKTPNEFPKTGETLPAQAAPDHVRALLIGGGSSHDFEGLFHKVDGEMLRKGGSISTAYSSNLEEVLGILPNADVVVLSANHRQFGSSSFQTALNQFADSGRGVVVVHAGGWHNWPPALGYNKRFVAGGARGHGGGEFKVFNRCPDHPVMKGVPSVFSISDEHYRSILDAGTEFEMLAETDLEPKTEKTYPAVWAVKDPKTRIVNISLGHGRQAHDNPAYQTLLTNAVRWSAGK
jgi:type 1 glutamine amidotransferase